MSAPDGASHRRRQALATRDLVAAAARRLFRDQGYTATSVESISKASGVPAQTIYSAFGSKPAILEHIREAWVAETRVRDLGAEAAALPDIAQRLTAAAGWTRRQFELGIDVIAVYEEAARADPRVAAAWRRVLAGREAAIREVFGEFMTGRRLDLYLALTLPAIYRALVEDRGWTPDAYQQWLAAALARDLLSE